MTSLEQAARARSEGVQQRSHRPQQRRAGEDVAGRAVTRATIAATQMREQQVNGMTVVEVGGYASVYERGYDMWDTFGPYTEVVSVGSAARTLASDPLVEFTRNHGAGGSLPMAHTRNGTLLLSEDDAGLAYRAFVDPSRSDVADMLKALERGDLAEASFKFRIDSGEWSPDFTEFRIKSFDLNRGDVSAVNFGANPSATSTLRGRKDRTEVRSALRSALRSTAVQMRALTPAEQAAVSSLLLQLAAAEAALDPIVDALCAADCALDMGTTTLAALLGIPNPDPEEMPADGADMADPGMQSDASRARLRALAASLT